MIRVLFVCTGNICRSPTAEGVFRHKVRHAGLVDRIGWDSAGTHGYHLGDPPDDRARRAALRRGVDLSDLRARKVVSADFADFDYILGMDGGHLAQLRRMKPADARSELALFLDFEASLRGREVPDPYYGDASDFEHALDLIEAGTEALLSFLRDTRI